MIRLYVLKFDGSCFDIPKQVFDGLSKERIELINKAKTVKKKKQLAFSELMVSFIAKELLGLTGFLQFEKGKHGKPYIKGYEDFNYNVSHSGCMVVVAVSNNFVGVDVEEIRQVDMKVADRCFTEKEKQYSKINEQNFFKVWTRKEAYIKRKGDAFFEVQPKTLAILEKPLSDCIDTHCVDEYIISVCGDDVENVDIVHLKEEDLY